MSADLLGRAQALFREGRRDEAVALVETAATEGDAEALFAIGNWRLFALHGPRDLDAAHAAFATAAGQGHVEAARTRAYLVAAGLGCDPDPEGAREMLAAIADRDPDAAAQLVLLGAPPSPPTRESLSADPRIEMIRGLLSEAECRHLMARAAPLLRPSFILEPGTGKPIPHPTRTSFGMNFNPTVEDLVVNAVNRRIAEASGTDYGWGEPLHILRYTPGQEYKPHLDALTGVANQRRWTVLVYLDDGYRGGETVFPELGVTARGKPGDALLFENADGEGRGDPRTRHAGRPVTEGTKWLATRWIRAHRHLPWDR